MEVTGYYLIDPRCVGELDVRYVGITTNPTHRLYLHIRDASKDVKTHKANWIRVLVGLGLKPVLQSQVVFDEYAAAEQWEVRTIAQMRREGVALTNTTNGGGGTLGRRHTEASNIKNRNAHIGRPLGPFSAKHCHRLSAAALERPKRGAPSAATRKLQSLAMTGRRMPIESLHKWRNRRHSEDTRITMSVAAFRSNLARLLAGEILRSWLEAA